MHLSQTSDVLFATVCLWGYSAMNWALDYLLAALAFILNLDAPPSPQAPPSKSIAIIGGGSAGLGALQVLLDVQGKKNLNWEVVLYEQRRGIGGVW